MHIPHRLPGAGLIGLLACLLAPSAFADGRRAEQLVRNLRDADGGVMVVAHRGCHESAPENSLAAFARCIELGVDVIELDARLSRDGELVLIHDDTLDRTTDGSGPVSALTLAELRRLRLRQGGGGAGAALTDHRIPTLREAMQAIDGNILVDLDAKGGDLPTVWAKAQALFEELGVAGEVTVKLTAARDEALRERVPLIREIVYLQRVDQRLGLPLSAAVRDGAEWRPAAYPVIFSDPEFMREGVRAVKDAGARVWAEPYHDASAGGLGDQAARRDPDASWGRLLELGATVLLTDRPEALVAYLRSSGRR